MKKYYLVALVLILGVYFLGCGKKQESLEDLQEPMSMDTLTTISTETKATPATQEQKVASIPVAGEVAPKMEALPPSGPFKPTATEIQTALKSAGYYSGSVDGKIGPMTKKSIEDFQKANGLTPDGKVGPKTWVALSKYLTAQPASSKTTGVN